jgi:predicted CopG family antitoxin
MSSTDLYPPAGASGPAWRPSWFARAEGWLDDRGKGAWIAATILGFILFWPVGLAFLAYMIWSKRMFNGSCAHRRAHHWANHRHSFRSSGNSAFDAYKAETLRRLEDEQESFEAFLNRLREAKDKSEFDQFMDERARRAREDADKGPESQS